MIPKDFEGLVVEFEKVTDEYAKLKEAFENLEKEHKALKQATSALKKENDALSKTISLKDQELADAKNESKENCASLCATFDRDTQNNQVLSENNCATLSGTNYQEAEINALRQLLEAKNEKISYYENLAREAMIKGSTAAVNSSKYEQLYRSKLDELLRSQKENEINIAKIAEYKNLNETYAKQIDELQELLRLKTKEDDILSILNKLKTEEPKPEKVEDVPQKKTKSRRSRKSKENKVYKFKYYHGNSSYEEWVKAYESGITSASQMVASGLCARRTHYRNLERYNAEHGKVASN